MYKLGIEITDVLTNKNVSRFLDTENIDLISTIYDKYQGNTFDFHFINEPIPNKSHYEVKQWIHRIGITKPKVTLHPNKLDAIEALGIDYHIGNNLELSHNLYFKGIKSAYYYPGYHFNMYFTTAFEEIEKRMQAR